MLFTYSLQFIDLCRFVLEDNPFGMTEENILLPDFGESVALPIQPVLSSIMLKEVRFNFKKETLGAVSVIHIYGSCKIRGTSLRDSGRK